MTQTTIPLHKYRELWECCYLVAIKLQYLYGLQHKAKSVSLCIFWFVYNFELKTYKNFGTVKSPCDIK